MKRVLALCAVVVLVACDPDGVDDVDRDAGGGSVQSVGDGGSEESTVDAGTPDAGTPDAGDSNACPAVDITGPRIVVTHRGPIQGREDGDVLSFRGIPYAAPPVDEKRWKAPEEPACWSELRQATDYGEQCPQLGATIVTGDEDCLFLNVWTKELAPETAKPVMFFIHGGAEIMGASNQQVIPGFNLYDGVHLTSEHDVVVVTVNYRLGPLGFLAHPALTDENPRQVSGNYGLLDVIHALKWVQKNIAKFGGDPGNVMIFGESAGALNTCALVASPLAAGLFHAALMESGDCVAPTLTDRERAGQQVAVGLGCTGDDVLECLRGKSPSDVILETHVDPDLFHVWDLPSGPAVDGYVLTDSPVKVLERGEHNHVPFIIGSNAHETEMFLPTVVNTCLDYYALMTAGFPNISDAVTDQYPCLDYLFPRWAAVDVTTDMLFTCPTRRTTRAIAASQDEPVWRYHYRHVATYGALAPLRAFHASELPYVFRTHDAMGYLATPAELDLSTEMMGYWARFARTHDPNGGDALHWPEQTEADARLLVLDTDIELVDGHHDEKCDFWDTLAP